MEQPITNVRDTFQGQRTKGKFLKHFRIERLTGFIHNCEHDFVTTFIVNNKQQSNFLVVVYPFWFFVSKNNGVFQYNKCMDRLVEL